MIHLKNICKNYGEKIIYKDFNLDIEEGKITVILGESGSGKTTLFNIITGTTDFSGTVEGVPKSVATVFQKNLLIKNLTVAENISLVCGNCNIEEGLQSVGLSEAKNLYPKQLSGGMARRVAILRALLFKSPLCLMDEPLVSLDLKLKFSLLNLIKETHERKGDTLVFVTHDIKEAVSIADRIIILKKRKIIYDVNQIKKDTEKEIFDILLETEK